MRRSPTQPQRSPKQCAYFTTGSWKRLPVPWQLVGLPASPFLVGAASVVLVIIAKVLPFMLFVVAFTTTAVVYMAWRTRIAVQRDMERLRGTIRELETKTRTLERARLANVISVKEKGKRLKEVEDLKKRVSAAEEECEELKGERDGLKEELKTLKKENVEYKGKTDKLEKKCMKLSKELENAVFVRWKLISRIHGDENARIAAINKLRKPLAHYHIDDLDGLSNHSHSPKRLRSPMGLSPTVSPSKFVPKSPSESYLLDLHPDLGVNESDGDDDLTDAMPALSLNSSSFHKTDILPKFPSPRKSSPRPSLLLSRAPWEKSRETSGLRNVSTLFEPHAKRKRSVSFCGL